MATLTQDIIAYLRTNNMVQGEGVDTFYDFVPDEPNHIIVVFEYSGLGGLKGTRAATRTVQISVRDDSAEVAKALADRIYSLFDVEENITYLTSTRWALISLKQAPFKIDVDALNRVTYGFNIYVGTNVD